LADARLSLGAALAESYVQLRSLDADAAILEKAVAAYQRALDLTHRRHDQGIAPGLDVAQAEAQLQTASSQLEQTRARRALTEHAIAALVGEPASRFSVSPAVVDLSLPAIPTGLPSTLLQRRPDVAAARSRVEAANAAIGVAKAAWFPSLVLGGQYGYQSSRLGNLISAPSTVWAWGPAAAVAVFDGGLRRGLERQAQAEFDASAAQYRVVALAAFQQVEDQLALLNHYGEASKSEEAAVQAAKRALRFSEELYRQGATDYLTVVASQTSALQAERDALTLTTDRLLASVTLIRALGGGWSSETDKAGTPTTVAVNPRAPGQAENLPPAPAAETPAGR
jgi:NodT family efflux transporter outer membrane factor (OMF) lipoprotein